MEIFGVGKFLRGNFFQKCSRGSNLFHYLRHLLRFGNLFGLFPFGNLWQGDVDKVTFRKWSGHAWWAAVPIVCLTFGLIHSSIALCKITGDVGKWVFSVENAVFYLCGLVCYTHFWRYGSRYTKLWRDWAEVPTQDPTLGKDVALISCVLISGILENLVWTFSVITTTSSEGLNRKESRSIWENIYNKTGNHVIPYNPVFSFYFLVANKYGIWGWTTSDVFVMILCRAMYGKFRAFNLKAEEELRTPKPAMIDILLQEHQSLRSLFGEMKELLSPLIFVLYGTNLYCSQLKVHLTITGQNQDKTLWLSVYAAWAFLQFLTKLYLTTIIGSRIELHVDKFGELLQDIPPQMETISVTRTRNLIQTKRHALTGLGCFTVSLPLLLKMSSFIITFEIVLLQADIQQGSKCVMTAST